MDLAETSTAGSSGLYGSDYTVVHIDGNSISAAAVGVTADGIGFVQAVRTIELPALAQRVVRKRHPIHMDVSCLEYDNTGVIQQALDRLLASSIFRERRLVGIFLPDKAILHSAIGPDDPVARGERRRAMVDAIQEANPYCYPSIFSMHEEILADGRERLRLWVARLEDVVATAVQFEKCGQRFAGLVNGMRACEEIFSLLGESEAGRPVSLVNIGKLHTLYLGGRGPNALFGHSIPVGLARDDMHYFQSITPTVEFLHHLHQRTGQLMFAPDMTPSPLFDPRASTPQTDCTRFSSQVARYASRTLQEKWRDIAGPETIQHYLLGHASRVPGLREYLDSKTGSKFRRFDRRPMPGLRLSPNVTWPDVADHLLNIGAGVAYIRRSQDNFGLIRRSNRPVKLAGRTIDAAALVPGKLYIQSHPAEVE